ncbi:MAG: hypothetical protein J5979_07540 [Lachnospiraceae bacterium]|nr:hypothetical protein [Lachnospiraceae bacterium]
MWGLEKKGLIVIERCSGIDYDITIQDNDFSYKEAWKEGYVNLHRKIFHQKRFLHLKAKEKYMLMYFLKITHENSSSYRIGIATFYAKFCKELHVTARVVRSYLHSLRAFFSVRIKDGKYFITYRSNVFRDSIPDRIESWYPKAFVSAIARRFKLRDVTQKQIEDTAYFFKQYKQIAQEQNLDIFQLIEEAVRRVALEEEKPKKRKLNPKYVHVKIREILF